MVVGRRELRPLEESDTEEEEDSWSQGLGQAVVEGFHSVVELLMQRGCC